jgi:hypothetical protein
MTGRQLRRLLLVLIAIALGSPVTTHAGTTADNLLELAAKGGGPALGFGVGVSRAPWSLLAVPQTLTGSAAADEAMLPEIEARRAVSLDVKLRWPVGDQPMGFEPYAVMGPALVVNSPHEPYSLFGTPSDPILRMGAKLGAGFNLRLNKATTLYGSYDVTTTTNEAFPALGAKSPAAGSPTTYDALYGIRFRY